MPWWLQLTIWLAIAYVVISVALYYLQEVFLFRPEKLPKDFQFYYENQMVEEYNM